MSYDMGIGPLDFNYTYNVAKMWYASEPEKGIRAIYGLTGEQALPVLRNMRAYMEDHWAEMLSYEPSNGWGSAKGAHEFLSDLIRASIDWPNDKWDGD
jgi:hypothetical protein